MSWWRLTGSNRRPPACKAGALPAELIPRLVVRADILVGLVGLEPTTPALSTRCSNQLSYSPKCCSSSLTADKCGRSMTGISAQCNSRKEVIQPHLPIRLPCYDFVPIIGPTLGACLLAVSTATSGKTNFRGVTGGVCKARERIHRRIADRRLLAIPTSWSRVADSNPN